MEALAMAGIRFPVVRRAVAPSKTYQHEVARYAIVVRKNLTLSLFVGMPPTRFRTYNLVKPGAVTSSTVIRMPPVPPMLASVYARRKLLKATGSGRRLAAPCRKGVSVHPLPNELVARHGRDPDGSLDSPRLRRQCSLSRGASFTMNSLTAGAVRKLKNSQGDYLWQQSSVAGQPDQLLGYPLLIGRVWTISKRISRRDWRGMRHALGLIAARAHRTWTIASWEANAD